MPPGLPEIMESLCSCRLYIMCDSRRCCPGGTLSMTSLSAGWLGYLQAKGEVLHWLISFKGSTRGLSLAAAPGYAPVLASLD